MARALVFPNRMIDLFAFEYYKNHPAHSKMQSMKEKDIWGWDTYNIEHEYARMGVYPTTSTPSATTSSPALPKQGMQRHRHYTSGRKQEHNDLQNGDHQGGRYRFSSVNAGYAICDSYPERLVVPNSITDWELTQCARFRRL